MKKTGILLALLFITFGLAAQRQTEYNRRGDEAMKRLDYRDAKIWYEEGVSNCDPYSIEQLTNIWLADESMRISMRSVMNKCLSCLNDRATESKDTVSINKLILYYTKGIGTSVNEATANFWKSQLTAINNRYVANGPQRKNSTPKTKMEFFAGYSCSFMAPYGLTVGGVGKTIGWYVRFRSNMSFQGYTESCSKSGEIDVITNSAYQYVGSKKANALIGTGGIVIKTAPSLYLSAGLGYWKRDVLYEFNKINLTETASEGALWARCGEGSYDGLAVDLDGMFRFGKVVYASAGVSAFNFKYVYMNAGIGMFF